MRPLLRGIKEERHRRKEEGQGEKKNVGRF